MAKIDRLLAYIRRTNPGMTRERLVEELEKCHYSSVGLIMMWNNIKNQGHTN